MLGDNGVTTLLLDGPCYEMHDTLMLKTGNTAIKLEKETDEIFSLITPVYTNRDTLEADEKFLATILYYPNGKNKQSGTWDKDNRKDYIWYYSDSTGTTIRKRLFRHGVLIDDNFKWDWENK
jgi:hypothetical protein